MTQKGDIGIICDLDGPLFDADAFLDSLRNFITENDPTNIQVFNNLYSEYKNDIETLCQKLSEQFTCKKNTISALFYNADIHNFLREGSKDFLQKMKALGECIVVTKGDPEFQQTKLTRLGIEGFPMSKKSQFICDQIRRMIDMGIEKIEVIDDRVKELFSVYELLPEELKNCVEFIHMPVGVHGNDEFEPTDPVFERHLKRATDFSTIESIVNRQLNEPQRELTMESHSAGLRR